MELIILGLFILAANYLGYKEGKGENIELNFRNFKPIIRTDEQEEKLVNKIRGK